MKITIREPESAITHFIALMLAMSAAMSLLAKAGLSGNIVTVCAMMVFMDSMAFLYSASMLYHATNVKQITVKNIPAAWPHDDLYPNCRLLHAGMPAGFR